VLIDGLGEEETLDGGEGRALAVWLVAGSHRRRRRRARPASVTLSESGHFRICRGVEAVKGR